MFKIADTCAWKASSASSWKLDTSATTTDSIVVKAARSAKEYPMLPTKTTSLKCAFMISYTRVVVVVLPLVPVIATSVPRE